MICLFPTALILCIILLLRPGRALAQGLPEKGDEVCGFKVREIRSFPLVGATAVLFTHLRTGAGLTYIANGDRNRVFDLTFLTRPVDDTGLPHVFEHATLAGSRKYPSKDLFFNLSYRTYNTFMNAMTYASMTTYPVASLSEAQLLRYADFYTDSCLNPSILTDESIWRQEAWRYRLDSPDGELTLEGTVYSEMKGAMTLERTASVEALRAAFPGSAAGFNQGGDPDHIPEMTWEQLRNYHGLFYHPSNCMAYLYGRFEDYTAFLRLLDDAFAPYGKKDFVFRDEGYRRLSESVSKEIAFPVETGGDCVHTACVYHTVVLPGLRGSPAEELVADTLATLLSADSSPLALALRKALPSGQLSVSLCTRAPDDGLVFSLSNVNREDAGLFLGTLKSCLAEIAENGFPPDFVDAAAASIALSSKMIADESGVGSSIVPSLAYSYSLSGDPFAYLEETDALDQIARWNAGGLYRRFIRERLLDPLTATVTVYPLPGAKEEKDAALAARLAEIKAGMGETELAEILRASAREAEPDDTAEMVAGLSAVTVASLPEEIRQWEIRDRTGADGVRRMDAVSAMDGAGSVQLFFDASGIGAEDLHWMKLLTDLWGDVDTGAHSWEELSTLEMRLLYNGDIRLNVLKDGRDFTPWLRVSWTSLHEDLERAYGLVREILTDSRFSDAERLADVLCSAKSALKTQLTGTIYSTQLRRAEAVRDPAARYYTWTNHLEYYRFLGEAGALLARDPKQVEENLLRVSRQLLCRRRAVAAYAGDEAGIAANRPLADAFMAALPEGKDGRADIRLPAPAAREAIVIDSAVQYNLIYADYETLGIRENGSLEAITALVADACLYPVLRDRYGAYSVFHNASEDQGVFIITYRDPTVSRAFGVFEELPALVAALDVPQETLDGYILSNYAGYALPKGELSGAVAALVKALRGKTQEETLRRMRELKATTPETVRAASRLYEALAARGVRSTGGGKAAIEGARQLFDAVLDPFGAGK